MTDPEIFDNSLKIEINGPKRKRRFKIFDPKVKSTEPSLYLLPVESSTLG
jgi:hypothetical protein